MFKLTLVISLFFSLLLPNPGHASQEITLPASDTVVAGGLTYVFLGENYGHTFTIAIGNPGSMWFYSFPKQVAGAALNPAKVATYGGNVYQSLATDAERIVLNLLDEKVAPTPLPSNYLIVSSDETAEFTANGVKYSFESNGYFLGGGDSTLYAGVKLNDQWNNLELAMNKPLRFQDVIFTCRFMHVSTDFTGQQYIVEYKYSPDAAIRPAARTNVRGSKPRNPFTVLGRRLALATGSRPSSPLLRY